MKKEKKKKRVVHIIKYLHEKFDDMKDMEDVNIKTDYAIVNRKKRYTNREYAIVLNFMHYYDLNNLEHQLEGTDVKKL
jgi:hypothetical protein